MNTVSGTSVKNTLETRYQNARGNLLWIVAFTVINIVLLVADGNSYFLFSAYIPYMMASLGMFLCGMFPQEFYGEEFAGVEFFEPTVFWIFMGIAAVMVALYLISWICSKRNRVGWLVFALTIFAVDTLGMLVLGGFSTDSIVDIVFHVWVIISLSLGVYSGYKLKKLPPEEPAPELEAAEQGTVRR